MSLTKSRSKNTQPELLVRKKLHSWGLRFRIHDRKLLVTPDIVFPREKIVVFINGCFWHQHGNCKNGANSVKVSEQRRQDFIKAGKRDLAVIESLRELGWNPITLWECEINEDLHSSAEKVALTVAKARHSR